jgi:hypothetical protein
MKKPSVRFALFSAVAMIAALVPASLAAEDSFGFGDPSDTASSSGASPVVVGGTVDLAAQAFVDEFDDPDSIRLGNWASGKLKVSAKGDKSEGYLSLSVDPAKLAANPSTLFDEALLRAFLGPVTLEGGVFKLNWGKADSQGPLDVINPLDRSDLTVLDWNDQKLAVPLLHAAVSIGEFSKVEAAFVPWFEGNLYDTKGRWTPAQASELPASVGTAYMTALGTSLYQKVVAGYMTLEQYQAALAAASAAASANLAGFDVSSLYPVTSGLGYFQGGLRFTTTLASQDIGFQYYYGYLRDPAVYVDTASLLLADGSFNAAAIHVAYNPYHQLGVDWASVLAGFNVRAEFAANLTSDLAGTDGAVYNPFLSWAFGFDRDLPLGINLNLQGTGSVRLMNDKVGTDLRDTESGTDMTKTRVTGLVSRSFLRDELKLSCTGIWGVEDMDYLIVPAVAWSKGDIEAKLAAGFFGGDSSGQLGQFDSNDYLKITVRYSF